MERACKITRMPHASEPPTKLSQGSGLALARAALRMVPQPPLESVRAQIRRMNESRARMFPKLAAAE